MSKSLGNLVFVSRLLAEGVDPMAIRLALMGHHYRSDHMWTTPEISRAEKLLERLRLNLSRVEVAPTSPIMVEILIAMSQDLNTEEVIALLVTWCEETESGETGGSAGELARFLDELLGLAF
jgi:L-cysteine:1D-myo-inositol 2-amino-2-deoxy-alpha-D-glucopyranoside ligase